MRRGSRRVHPDVRPLSVFGDPPRARDAHRSGLRSRREWMRLQAQEFGECHIRSATTCAAELLNSIDRSIDRERTNTVTSSTLRQQWKLHSHQRISQVESYRKCLNI